MYYNRIYFSYSYTATSNEGSSARFRSCLLGVWLSSDNVLHAKSTNKEEQVDSGSEFILLLNKCSTKKMKKKVVQDLFIDF